MSVSEFEIIEKYFKSQGGPNKDFVELGIGDDCALISVPEGMHLALSMDVLQENVHFPQHAPARYVASRAMAANLSDLAAMGAEPAFFTLGLSLPHSDEYWLQEFSAGLFAYARDYACTLIGGDLSQGPLGLCIQVHGFVPRGKALQRCGAKPGDLVFVTGTTGDAGAALRLIQDPALQAGIDARDLSFLQQRYYEPQPRVAFACGLREFAHSAIDISDGLLADLGHIAELSGVSITLESDDLPLSEALLNAVGRKEALKLAACAGDDYEVAFTAAPDQEPAIRELAAGMALSCTRIGVVETGRGVSCVDSKGVELQTGAGGYVHFGEQGQ